MNLRMPKVRVIDKTGADLAPCHAARARQLLNKKRAVVVTTNPYCIKLKYEPEKTELFLTSMNETNNPFVQTG